MGDVRWRTEDGMGEIGRMEVELSVLEVERCEIPMHVGRWRVIRLLYDTPGQV